MKQHQNIRQRHSFATAVNSTVAMVGTVGIPMRNLAIKAAIILLVTGVQVAFGTTTDTSSHPLSSHDSMSIEEMKADITSPVREFDAEQKAGMSEEEFDNVDFRAREEYLRRLLKGVAGSVEEVVTTGTETESEKRAGQESGIDIDWETFRKIDFRERERYLDYLLKGNR